MTNAVRKLFWMDFRSKMRNKKILYTVTGLILVYGLTIFLNLPGYLEIVTKQQMHHSSGLYLKVPLQKPTKTYSYFAPYEMMEEEFDGGTGFIFYPDRYEDPGVTTERGRFFFLLLACIVILFAHNELTDWKDHGLYQSLILAPIRKREIYRAKMILGAVVLGLVILLESLLVIVLMELKEAELTGVQWKQIFLYNLLSGGMLYLIYAISLAIGTRGKESGVSLLYSLIALVIMIYLLPVTLENIRNYLYYQLPQEWRGDWYWYSRYLAVIDPFGSFGEITSEMLFLGRARLFYTNLPWSRELAQGGEFTIGKLFLLNWYKPLALFFWIVGIWVSGERRLEKGDAV